MAAGAEMARDDVEDPAADGEVGRNDDVDAKGEVGGGQARAGRGQIGGAVVHVGQPGKPRPGPGDVPGRQVHREDAPEVRGQQGQEMADAAADVGGGLARAAAAPHGGGDERRAVVGQHAEDLVFVAVRQPVPVPAVHGGILGIFPRGGEGKNLRADWFLRRRRPGGSDSPAGVWEPGHEKRAADVRGPGSGVNA